MLLALAIFSTNQSGQFIQKALASPVLLSHQERLNYLIFIFTKDFSVLLSKTPIIIP